MIQPEEQSPQTQTSGQSSPSSGGGSQSYPPPPQLPPPSSGGGSQSYPPPPPLPPLPSSSSGGGQSSPSASPSASDGQKPSPSSAAGGQPKPPPSSPSQPASPSSSSLGQASHNCPSDVDLIKQGEDIRKCKYYDTKGIPTICYGQNLQNSYAASSIRAVGADASAVMSGQACLTESQCKTLLNQDVARARAGMKSIYGDSVTCPCAQNVLVDMTYNLGEYQLAKFTTFNSLIKQGNWKAAGDDLVTGTAWCRQVGTRCDRNVKLIKSCSSQSHH